MKQPAVSTVPLEDLLPTPSLRLKSHFFSSTNWSTQTLRDNCLDINCIFPRSLHRPHRFPPITFHMSNYARKAYITQADANVMGFPKLFLFHRDSSGYNVIKTLCLPQITMAPRRHHKVKETLFWKTKRSFLNAGSWAVPSCITKACVQQRLTQSFSLWVKETADGEEWIFRPHLVTVKMSESLVA